MHEAPQAVKLTVMLAALFLGTSVAGAAGQTPEEVQTVCASCHANLDVARFKNFEHGDSVSCLSCHHIGFSNDSAQIVARRDSTCAACHTKLSPSHLGHTGEGTPTCTTCHSIHSDPPSVADAGANISKRCTTCHEKRHVLHAGVPNGPECTQCHTLHAADTTASAGATQSDRCTTCHQPHPTHQKGEDGHALCTQCHAIDGPSLKGETAGQRSDLCAKCHEGHATHTEVKEGAPTCTDCHSVATDPPVAQAGPAISNKCSVCHEKERADYDFGGHAAGLRKGDPNPDLPTCITCHPAHVAPGTVQTSVRLEATMHCIKCHSNKKLDEKYGLPVNAVASYEKDYHGATLLFLAQNPTAQAQPDVLTCEDCHGPHAVGWSGKKAVAQVCLRCHKKGDPKLAGAWLGHAPITSKNQLVIWLVRLFYFLMIPTVLTGLALHIVFELRHERGRGARLRRAIKALPGRFFRRGKEQKQKQKVMVSRFSVLERLEHVGAAITFIMLAITGLPQNQPNGRISHAIIAFFGGIGTTRLIHRINGFIFVVLLVLHIVGSVSGAMRRKKVPDMVPRPHELHDALQMLWHRLKGTPAPRVGRFDFSEKFEYWGLFMGGIVMSVTGLSLVWPQIVTHYLPGIVIAMTRTIHGFEATFAVLVVLLWHTWSVILRPEIFPLDTAMFTGKISLERLKEEHRAEYDRRFGDAPGDEAPQDGD